MTSCMYAKLAAALGQHFLKFRFTDPRPNFFSEGFTESGNIYKLLTLASNTKCSLLQRSIQIDDTSLDFLCLSDSE